MNFTIQKDQEINSKIFADLEIIKKAVLNILNQHVHSIILVGGFGRGEGTVLKSNNIIQIVNDYDILIVLKHQNPLKYAYVFRCYSPQIEKLSEDLAKKLQIKQVDLGIKHLSYFSKPASLKIENYEVEKGQYVIYGFDNPTLVMPNWKAQDLPLFEGTWLFRNRGIGLLIAAKYFLGEGFSIMKNKENFLIECGKAQLAMGDSLLLLKGKYHYLYYERLKRIENLDVSDVPNGNAILKHYRKALRNKLNLSNEVVNEEEILQYWFTIVNLFTSFFHFYEINRLGQNFNDWTAYCNLKKPESRLGIEELLKLTLGLRIKNILPKSIKQNLIKYKKSLSIEIMALLLFSIHESDFNKIYLDKAAYILKYKMSSDISKDWNSLTSMLLLKLHPAGEAGRVAQSTLN